MMTSTLNQSLSGSRGSFSESLDGAAVLGWVFVGILCRSFDSSDALMSFSAMLGEQNKNADKESAMACGVNVIFKVYSFGANSLSSVSMA